MAIDSRDFIGCSDNIKIFIHAAGKYDLKNYEMIGIKSEKSIIKASKSNDRSSATQYYFKQLQENKQKSIVILHNAQLDH